MLKPRLKVLLAEKGMTQKRLSEITGIRLPTISALSNGNLKELPLQVLDSICEALDCQPGDLWTRTKNDTSARV